MNNPKALKKKRNKCEDSRGSKFERAMKIQNKEIFLSVDNASGHNVCNCILKKTNEHYAQIFLSKSYSQAICMVREAWNKISSKTIANCWRHADNY